VELALTGILYDEASIEGMDCVLIDAEILPAHVNREEGIRTEAADDTSRY